MLSSALLICPAVLALIFQARVGRCQCASKLMTSSLCLCELSYSLSIQLVTDETPLVESPHPTMVSSNFAITSVYERHFVLPTQSLSSSAFQSSVSQLPLGTG